MRHKYTKIRTITLDSNSGAGLHQVQSEAVIACVTHRADVVFSHTGDTFQVNYSDIMCGVQKVNGTPNYKYYGAK